MDINHTVNENLNKVKALIDAVDLLYKIRNDLTTGAMLFQIESLKTLSEETYESLQTIKQICYKKPNA